MVLSPVNSFVICEWFGRGGIVWLQMNGLVNSSIMGERLVTSVLFAHE